MFRYALDVRLPYTGIRVNCPTVCCPLDTTATETTEVLPADYMWETNGYKVYDIADGEGGWIPASNSDRDEGRDHRAQMHSGKQADSSTITSPRRLSTPVTTTALQAALTFVWCFELSQYRKFFGTVPTEPCGPHAILVFGGLVSVRIILDIPDEIAAQLAARGQELSRSALEALALESYRLGALTQVHVGRLLGLSRIETEDFLAQHLDLYDYEPNELRRESDALSRLSDNQPR